MRIFLSYHTPDRDKAERLGEALQRSRPQTEVFFAPRSILGGSYWQQRLAIEIDQSDAVLLLLGEKVGPWQEDEYFEARRLSRKTERAGKPTIIPVVLADRTPGLPFLNLMHQLYLPEPTTNQGLASIEQALDGVEIKDTEPAWRRLNPYKGLPALTTSDAAYFFGREALCGDILDRIGQREKGVLALIGSSGVGKSSLAQAGVLGSLKSDLWPGHWDRPWPEVLKNSRSWLQVSMTPGEAPLRRLALAFASLWLDSPADREEESIKCIKLFKSGSTLSGLIDATNIKLAELTNASAPARIVLYVDQGEELYSRASKDQALLFSKLIAEASQREGVNLFASFRSDYYGHLQADHDLFSATQRIDVPPLDAPGLHAVIEKPALLFGAKFENSRMPKLLATTAAEEAGALPLLSDLLSDMWERMRQRNDGEMRWSDKPDVVDLSAALEDRADAYLKQFPDRTTNLRRLLTLRLAHVPRDGDPVRRRARKSECSETEWQIAEELAGSSYRLLTLGEDRASGEPTVEVAHEQLLHKWGTLREWLKDQNEFLVWRGSVDAMRRDWESANKSDEALLMGLPLKRAIVHLAERGSDLSPQDRQFILKSGDAERTEVEARQERELALAKEREEAALRSLKASKIIARRTKIGLIASSLLFVIAALAGWFALERENVAKIQSVKARQNSSAAMTALAVIETPKNPQKAAKLAMAAWPKSAKSDLRGMEVTLNALSTVVPHLRERLRLKGHEDAVTSAAFSSNGARIVTASWDGTARIWEARTGKETIALKGHGDAVKSAAFSPDGARVVTASADMTARIWDATSGKEMISLQGHEGQVNSAAFSPDGTRVVTSSGEGDVTTRVWDVATGKQIFVLNLGRYQDSVESAAFSPDGTRFMAVLYDQTAKIWDARTGEEITALKAPIRGLISAAFSPDGASIVTASTNGTARIWDARTGQETIAFKGHGDAVNRAAFSPDGARVVTASSDKTVRIWDAVSGEEIIALKAHEGAVHGAAFSPDGARIVTASWDKTARIWDVETGKEIIAVKGHEETVRSASYSRDGTRIVASLSDESVRILDAATGREIMALKGVPNSDVREVVLPNNAHAEFSPDGTRIVAAIHDTAVWVWDAATGLEVITLQGHEETVHSAAFSTDGARIATASKDNTARIWDARTGKEIIALQGHQASVYTATFSTDSARVVTASLDRTARIWDAATGKGINALTGHDQAVNSAAFSPDGALIVTTSYDRTARIWDAATGKEIIALTGHDQEVNSAAFSPDGARIVTSSGDSTARVWDTVTGKEIIALRGHDQVVNSAAFSPDGTRIVTASSDKTARIWNVSAIPKGNILDIACAWLPDRSLSDRDNDYNIIFDEPICETRPPIPELPWEDGIAKLKDPPPFSK